MKKVSLFLFVFLTSISHGFSTEYFVNSTTGIDANAGTSINDAWKTLAPVQAAAFQPGDIINFARGSSWTKSCLGIRVFN